MRNFEKDLSLALILNETVKAPHVFWRAVKAVKKELQKYPPEQHQQMADLIVNKMALIFPEEDREITKRQLKAAIKFQ